MRFKLEDYREQLWRKREEVFRNTAYENINLEAKVYIVSILALIYVPFLGFKIYAKTHSSVLFFLGYLGFLFIIFCFYYIVFMVIISIVNRENSKFSYSNFFTQRTKSICRETLLFMEEHKKWKEGALRKNQLNAISEELNYTEQFDKFVKEQQKLAEEKLKKSSSENEKKL